MVMSIGWNPFFGNSEKTAEPWLLADFEAPFYDQEIRLVACGYVRPEVCVCGGAGGVGAVCVCVYVGGWG